MFHYLNATLPEEQRDQLLIINKQAKLFMHMRASGRKRRYRNEYCEGCDNTMSSVPGESVCELLKAFIFVLRKNVSETSESCHPFPKADVRLRARDN